MKTFLISTQRYRQESLYSFIARLARLNGYEPPRLLINPLVELLGGCAGKTVWRPQDNTTFHLLAGLTQCPIMELEAAVPPPYLPCHAPSATRFCPRCLTEMAYHHVPWMVDVATTCPRHRCLLADRCPGCKKPVSVQSVVDGICQQCRTPLADMEPCLISNDMVGLLTQRALHSWIVTMPSHTSGDDEALHLLPEERWDLVERFHALVVQAYPQKQGSHHDLYAPYVHVQSTTSHTLLYTHVTYTLAIAAVLHWPHGFYQFLAELPIMWHAFALCWSRPCHHVVQDAFEHFIGTYVLPAHDLVQRANDARAHHRAVRYVPSTIAEQQLNVSPRVIQHLVEARDLRGSTITAGTFVEAGSLRRIHRHWHLGLSMHAVSRWLGVSVAVVRELVERGVLTTQGRSTPQGEVVTIERSSVIQCINTIDACEQVPHSHFHSLTLAQAARLTQLSIAQLLHLILSGQLRCWRDPDGPVRFTAVRVYNPSRMRRHAHRVPCPEKEPETHAEAPE